MAALGVEERRASVLDGGKDAPTRRSESVSALVRELSCGLVMKTPSAKTVFQKTTDGTSRRTRTLPKLSRLVVFLRVPCGTKERASLVDLVRAPSGGGAGCDGRARPGLRLPRARAARQMSGKKAPAIFRRSPRPPRRRPRARPGLRLVRALPGRPRPPPPRRMDQSARAQRVRRQGERRACRRWLSKAEILRPASEPGGARRPAPTTRFVAATIRTTRTKRTFAPSSPRLCPPRAEPARSARRRGSSKRGERGDDVRMKQKRAASARKVSVAFFFFLVRDWFTNRHKRTTRAAAPAAAPAAIEAAARQVQSRPFQRRRRTGRKASISHACVPRRVSSRAPRDIQGMILAFSRRSSPRRRARTTPKPSSERARASNATRRGNRRYTQTTVFVTGRSRRSVGGRIARKNRARGAPPSS